MTSSSAAAVEFDVLLSFGKGDDGSGIFAEQLIEALHERDVRVRPAGRNGGADEANVIEASSVCIPIFCSSYAYSRRCLRELSEFVARKKIILPVFYGVDPSDVRRQRGPFEPAFRDHKLRLDGRTVEGWREAMEEVGEIVGYVLADVAGDGDKAKLIQLIVKRVLRAVKHATMDVVEHLVGIQSRVEDVMKLLSLETEDVKMIGIHGMGGIGKTTLAKVVYNQMFKSFDASCFLSDIRETSKQHKGLILLQEKLISEILNFEKFEITDVSQGIATIKSRFHIKRLLIVLDDVDHNNQLDALVGSRHWFCGGRIIITTRYKHVLNVQKLNKDEFYQPGELNRVESLELFSLHAFEKSQPENDYIELSDKIIKAAGGLPLALEVLGAFLFGKKDVKEWEDLLEGLQHIPFDDVQRRLKLSYDSLDPEEKKIFLDLACFFISPTKDRVTDILKSCGFYASLAITVLQHRSLVKIDKNRLEMHDQLRELGKGIVRENSSFNPGLCSRLWVTDEVLDVLDNQKGTGNIEGIVVDLRGLLSKRRVKTKSFARMMNLRLLRANFAEFEGNFKHMPTGLRWLEWHGCPLKSLPNDFSLEKVAVLDLSLSRVVQLWSSRCYFRKKVFNELKVLILSGCSHLKKTPDFSSSPRLEKLILKGCQELVQVDESIGKLDRLAVLDLSLCSKLERLPNAICSLSSLKNLDLSRCTDLQMLPMQWGVMGSFRSLRQLSLFRCSNLQELPDSFGVMPRLEKLNLTYCQSLKTLPDSIGDMKRLSELYLMNVALVQLPSSIGSLVELKGLWMFGCNKLKSLPDTLGHLMKLEKLNLKNVISFS